MRSRSRARLVSVAVIVAAAFRAGIMTETDARFPDAVESEFIIVAGCAGVAPALIFRYPMARTVVRSTWADQTS